MARGPYKRSTYMVLKQAAKTVLNNCHDDSARQDGIGWRTAIDIVAYEDEKAYAAVNTLLENNGAPVFHSSHERAIGLLLAAEASR